MQALTVRRDRALFAITATGFATTLAQILLLRELLGSLCRATWETVSELVAEAAGEDVRPGMLAVLHSASADLRWHPHVHALTSRGGWDR